MNVSPIDWIIAAVFLGLLGPGGWTRKYFVKNVAGFLAAGRHVRKFLCLGTYASSGTGTETSTGLAGAAEPLGIHGRGGPAAV